MSVTVGTDMIAITRTTYADGAALLLRLYCMCLMTVLTYRYNNSGRIIMQPLTKHSQLTFCTDQLAALEFHASAVRVLGAAGG